MTDIDWGAIRAAFVEPFADTQYRVGSTSKRKEGGKYPAGTRGQLLAYIDARQVADRLDDTVGPENWTDLYRTVDATAKAIECTLTVCGVTKVDVGYPNSANDGDDKEPLKAAYSDALKRAAVKFGIGRYLYDLDAAWVDIDEWGKPLRTPQARPAALPNGSGATPARTGTRSAPATPSAVPSPAPSSQPMPQAAAVPPAKAKPDKDGRYYCAAPDCGVVLASYEFEGRTVLPQTLADQSFKRFGLVLCLEHATAAKQGLAS